MNPAAELSRRLTERALKKIEQDSPRVSREHMMRLVVDADLPQVLRTAVERYGWRHVLEMLRELAYMQSTEFERVDDEYSPRAGAMAVIGKCLDTDRLYCALNKSTDLGKKD